MVVSSNPESVAAGIVKLFDRPDLAAQFSKNGRQMIASELTIGHVVTRLENIYQGARADVSSPSTHAVIG